jgi:hypothetical protein
MDGWKKGPMPADTFGWGGIVSTSDVTVKELEEGSYTGGFQFADFRGDHILLPMQENRRVEAENIAFYNNSITLPIKIES